MISNISKKDQEKLKKAIRDSSVNKTIDELLSKGESLYSKAEIKINGIKATARIDKAGNRFERRAFITIEGLDFACFMTYDRFRLDERNIVDYVENVYQQYKRYA